MKRSIISQRTVVALIDSIRRCNVGKNSSPKLVAIRDFSVESHQTGLHHKNHHHARTRNHNNDKPNDRCRNAHEDSSRIVNRGRKVENPIDLSNINEVTERMWKLARSNGANEALQLWRALQSSFPRTINSKIVAGVLQSIVNARDIPNKGLQAEQIWTEAQQFVKPNVILYNCLINAHSKTFRDEERGMKAEAWLRRMHDTGIQPDKFSYTSVIDAHGIAGLDHAERLLEEYIQKTPSNQLATGPFSALMRVSSKHPTEARTRTEQIMERLSNMVSDTSIYCYMNVLNSLVGHEDGGVRAEEWCKRYEEKSGQKTDEGLWVVVLHAWAMSGRPDSGRQADRIMRKIFQERHVTVTTKLNNVWMNCWTKSGDKRALERVMQILHDMEMSNPPHNSWPDSLSYSAAMQSWAKSGLPEAPQKAEMLWSRMQKHGLFLNLQCYEAVMDAHARTDQGTKRVLQILALLEKMKKTNGGGPSVRSYAAALLALSHAPGRSRDAEKMIERMKQHGVEPNAHCYSLLITCYANDRKPEKAIQVLDSMGEPNLYIYTAVISALANCGKSRMAKEVLQRAEKHCQETGEEMTIVPLAAVLHALKEEGTMEAAEEAESLLLHTSMKPSAVALSSVIAAWGQLQQVDRAVGLFELARKTFPYAVNTIVYTCLIMAYASADDAAYQVERLLTEMRATTDCTPTNVTLTTAIDVYVRNNRKEKALELLNEMEQTYERTGNESIKPLPKAYELIANRRCA